MPSKEELDRYANELVQRFDALTEWAIANWPNPDFPLMESDFAGARHEISEIVGPKLGDGNSNEQPEPGKTSPGRQYVDMNPSPWP